MILARAPQHVTLKNSAPDFKFNCNFWPKLQLGLKLELENFKISLWAVNKSYRYYKYPILCIMT